MSQQIAGNGSTVYWSTVLQVLSLVSTCKCACGLFRSVLYFNIFFAVSSQGGRNLSVGKQEHQRCLKGHSDGQAPKHVELVLRRLCRCLCLTRVCQLHRAEYLGVVAFRRLIDPAAVIGVGDKAARISKQVNPRERGGQGSMQSYSLPLRPFGAIDSRVVAMVFKNKCIFKLWNSIH